MIGAVIFDMGGECLVDETQEYGTWADWLGVPRHVFSAVFGAVIARGPGSASRDCRVGIAGNQTARAGGILRDLRLPADLIASSDDWGVSKPDPGFFRKMVEVSPSAPDQTLYLDDRLDNDIVPASELGLRTALINRGP